VRTVQSLWSNARTKTQSRSVIAPEGVTIRHRRAVIGFPRRRALRSRSCVASDLGPAEKIHETPWTVSVIPWQAVALKTWERAGSGGQESGGGLRPRRSSSCWAPHHSPRGGIFWGRPPTHPVKLDGRHRALASGPRLVLLSLDFAGSLWRGVFRSDYNLAGPSTPSATASRNLSSGLIANAGRFARVFASNRYGSRRRTGGRHPGLTKSSAGCSAPVCVLALDRLWVRHDSVRRLAGIARRTRPPT